MTRLQVAGVCVEYWLHAVSSIQASVVFGGQDHVRRLEGGQSSLGLNASSVSSYHVGEITRFIGQLTSLILRGGVLL